LRTWWNTKIQKNENSLETNVGIVLKNKSGTSPNLNPEQEVLVNVRPGIIGQENLIRPQKWQGFKF
jgi:hypothetical protein